MEFSGTPFLCPYVKGCFLTVLLLVYLLFGDDNDVFSKKVVETFDFSYFSFGRFILFRVTCAVSLWENICLFRDGKVEKFPACWKNYGLVFGIFMS